MPRSSGVIRERKILHDLAGGNGAGEPEGEAISASLKLAASGGLLLLIGLSSDVVHRPMVSIGEVGKSLCLRGRLFHEKERPCSGVTGNVGLSSKKIVAWKIRPVYKFVTFFTRLIDDCHISAFSAQPSALRVEPSEQSLYSIPNWRARRRSRSPTGSKRIKAIK